MMRPMFPAAVGALTLTFESDKKRHVVLALTFWTTEFAEFLSSMLASNPPTIEQF